MSRFTRIELERDAKIERGEIPEQEPVDLPDKCPHCGVGSGVGTTTLCAWCHRDYFEPTKEQKAAMEAELQQGELEIYRMIRRGELP